MDSLGAAPGMSSPAWSLLSSWTLLVCPMSPGMSSPHSSPLCPAPQWTSCIEAVSQNKDIFPGLTNISEVVTDQFLCSGMEGDDNPCKG